MTSRQLGIIRAALFFGGESPQGLRRLVANTGRFALGGDTLTDDEPEQVLNELDEMLSLSDDREWIAVPLPKKRDRKRSRDRR